MGIDRVYGGVKPPEKSEKHDCLKVSCTESYFDLSVTIFGFSDLLRFINLYLLNTIIVNLKASYRYSCDIDQMLIFFLDSFSL